MNYLQQFDLHIEEDALQTGLSLVLGTGESNLFRLTRAYTTFAHSGEYQDVDEILEITDTSGHTLYTPSPRTPERRMSVDTAEWVTHALSDTQAKWDIFKR